MLTAAWTVLAVAAMVGMFAACVIVVAAGVRLLEGALLARRRKAPAVGAAASSPDTKPK